MIKHCPTCERTSKEARFVGEFCEFCVAGKIEKKFPTKAEIVFCKRCGRVKGVGSYFERNDEVVASILSRELCGAKCQIKLKSYDEKMALVQVTYPVDGDWVVFDRHIELKWVHEICQDDYRKSSGYYEAVVQIRGGNREKIQKMEEKIRKFLEMRGAFIAKTEEADYGMDIYTSDKMLTKGFLTYNKLPVKASYTLYSIKNGKEIYRHTYLLKLK